MWFFPKSFMNKQQINHQSNGTEPFITKTKTSGNDSQGVDTIWTQVKGASQYVVYANSGRVLMNSYR